MGGGGEEAGQEVLAELVAEVDQWEEGGRGGGGLGAEGGGEVGDLGEEGVGLGAEPERLQDVESESIPELPELDIRVGVE